MGREAGAQKLQNRHENECIHTRKHTHAHTESIYLKNVCFIVCDQEREGEEGLFSISPRRDAARALFVLSIPRLINKSLVYIHPIQDRRSLVTINLTAQ